MAVMAFGLTACGGSSGSSDTAGLTAPLAATVTDELGRAPDNVINAETVSAVEVAIELAPDSLATDEVTVTLSDGTNDASVTIPGVEGGGEVVAGPIDASGLQDGPLEMTVTIRRGDRELVTSFSNALVLDATPPAPALTFQVPAGENNAEGLATSQTAGSMSAVVTFGAESDPADLCTLFFSDGSEIVESLTENVSPNGSVTFAGINISSLTDGQIQVTVRVQDAAENSSDLMATMDKDVSVPMVESAKVLAGQTNADHQINADSETLFKVEVGLTGGEAGDSVQVVIRDSESNEFRLDAVDAPMGGGVLIFDASSINMVEGTINIDVIVSDASGNSQTTAGSPATKDVTISEIASLSFRSSGSDADRDVISGADSSEVYVFAQFDPQMSGANENYTLRIDSESGMSVTPPQAPLASSQSQIAFGPFDLSAFPEGSIQAQIALVDDHGNQDLTRGREARIDRSAHPGHDDAFVVSSGSNPNLAINGATASSTTVQVQAQPYEGDTVTAVVTLSDGFTTVSSAPVEMPLNGGSVNFTGIDASTLVDGQTAIEVIYSDPFGNQDRYAGQLTKKDTQIATPTYARVISGASSSPSPAPEHGATDTSPMQLGGPSSQDWINAQEASSVRIDIGLPTDVVVGDVYGLRVGDGTTEIDLGSQVVNLGVTVLSFTNLNLTSLADGPISITVWGSDNVNNQNMFAGQPALKDNTPPAGILSLQVAPGANNGYHEINGSNLMNPRVEVRFDPASLAGDFFVLSFSDNTTKIFTQALHIQGPGTFVVDTNVDLSHLADGPIVIHARCFDAAGNETEFPGTASATKNTASVQPTLVQIPAGAGNPANYINASNVASTTIEVTMPASTVGNEDVSVQLRTGSTILESASQTATAGGSLMTFVMDTSSLDEGPVQIVAKTSSAVTVEANTPGTPATKDTVLPALTSLLRYDDNHDGFINANEEPSFDFSVNFIGETDGDDFFTLTISDGSSTLVLGPQAISNAQPLTMSFNGTDFSSLADGALTFTADITDSAGNLVTENGGFATKDTIAPGKLENLVLKAGANNPENVINQFNESGAGVSFNAEAGEDTETSVAIAIRDANGTTINLESDQLSNPGQTEPSLTFDATSMLDGQIIITAMLTDRAGNTGGTTTANAFKDTTGPTAPTSISVEAGASNPAGFVNFATASSADITVGFGPDSLATDSLTIRVSDGSAMVSRDGLNATAGMASMAFTAFDLSTLADGNLTITVELADEYGNITTAMDSSTLKDVVAPDVPTSLEILSSADNNAGFITLATQASAQALAIWPATATGNEEATLTIGSTSGSAESVPAGGGVQNFAGIDVSGESDGVLNLSVLVTEPSGNTASFIGILPEKDTVLPMQPTAVSVPMTSNNPVGFINTQTQAMAQAEVTWPAGSDVTDTAVLRFSDGSFNAEATSVAVVPGGNSMHTIDASFLGDGALSAEVDVFDAAGNKDTFTMAMAATKDTQPPALPTVAGVIDTEFNSENYISNSSQNMVSVAVVWPAEVLGNESFTVVLSDGTNSVNSTSTTVAGPGTQLVMVDATSLSEGIVTMVVDIVSAGGNGAAFDGIDCEKDVTPPGTPTNATVAAGSTNPAGVINSDSVDTVQVDVTWPLTALATDSAIVKIAVGGTEVESMSMMADPGAVVTYTIDASSLDEGQIVLTVDVLDAAKNDNVFAAIQGDKDTIAPADPTSAGIVVSGTNNLNEINGATAGTVMVDVVWDGSAEAADTATVRLTDSSTQTSSPSQSVTPSATQTYTLDASGLNDGSISMLVEVTDPNGNTNTFIGTTGAKDTVDPVLPTAGNVIDSGSNPMDIINGSNVAAVEMDFVWPALADAADTAVLTISDTVNMVSSGSVNPTPGAAQRFTLNAGTLNDGAVSLSLEVTDAFGNVATYLGTSATKDLVDPVSATSAVIAAGSDNVQGIINTFNEAMTQVDVVWPVGSEATEMATVTLSDGSGSVTSTAMAVVPNGMTSFTVDASGLNDGAISVTVDIEDVARNMTQDIFVGASKDALAPMAASSGVILMGPNNDAGVINLASEGAVLVDVTWPAGADGADTAVVALLSGGMEALSPSASVFPGGTSTYTVDASTLPDGPVTVEIRASDAAGNLTSAFGTAGTKDATAPVLPVAFAVSAGADNDANIINIASQGTVSVTVLWSASSEATDMASVTLTQGGTTATSMLMAANPSGSTVFTIDASGLTDGAVALSIDIEDNSRNTATGPGGAATKDTVAPTAPTTASVNAGSSNGANEINSDSVATVMVDVTWPGGADAADTAIVTLSDGSATATSMSIAANPGATVTYAVDASGLGEGPITVSVTASDVNRNTSTLAGTGATKDTTAPTAPTAALIPMTVNNPASVINSSNEAATMVDVTWDGSADGTDTVIVRLQAGAMTADSASTNPTPSATQSFSVDTTGMAEGPITASVIVTDTFGNETTFAGVPATKDITDPNAPTAAAIPAGADNGADSINATTAATVDVQVSWPSNVDPADSAFVTLSNGGGSFQSATANPTPGMMQTFTVDASGLDEGAVTVSVETSDPSQNSIVFVGTPATMDTVAPGDPTRAQVMAGATNPDDFINNQNEDSVEVQVDWPAASDDTATAIVTLSDGSASVQSSAMAVTSSTTVSYSIDANSLADGPVTVTVETTDPAGNTATYGGIAATKNATAPEAPQLFQIAAGVDNDPNTVNAMTETSVNFAVNYVSSSEVTDMVTLTIGDGAGTVVVGPMAARAGAGIEIYAGNDLSGLLDGNLTLDIMITDTAGNEVTYSGTAAFKDTATGNATAAAVPSGANNNADGISAMTANAVTVNVTMNADSGGEDVFVTLSDGSGSVQSSTQQAPNGGGMLVFSGIDASSLAEGMIDITVSTTDSQMNTLTFVGTQAAKDTVAPEAPTAAGVIDSGANDPDQINLSNESAVSVEITWPVTVDDSDTFTVTLSDGSGTAQSASTNVQTGGGMQTVMVDASSLADAGSLTMTIDTTDAAGNVDSTGGTSPLKDTTVTAVSAISIAAGANNKADTISSATASSAQVDVTFAAGADGTEDVTITLDDANGGTVAVTDGPQSLSMGQTMMSFSGLDVSGLDDGPITVTITVADDQRNSVDAAPFTPEKDVVAPGDATAAAIPAAAGNSADFIAIANEGSVSVQVTVPASSKATDEIFVTLNDGSNSAMGSAAAIDGAGNVTVSGIDASSLNESGVTISVMVEDVAGNTSGAFAGTAATKDVTAPADPIVDPVTTPTADATQAVTGSTEADATIDITGGSAPASGTADSAGFYSVDVTLATDATNSLSLIATDTAGNPSSAVTADFNTDALDVVHSSTAPAAPFSDQTVAYGLGDTGTVRGGGFADIDNDGDLDLFVGGVGKVYEFTGSAFSDITATAGTGFACDLSAVWGDYDNDGDVDLLTLDSTNGTKLFRNNFVGLGTKTFTDVTATETAGVISATATAVFWLDQNADGFLDFFITDGAASSNSLMINQRGAMSPSNTFAADATTGLETAPNGALSGTVADFDVDGDIDVLFGSTAPGYFFRNDGATFTDIADGGGSGVNMAITLARINFVDYDNDGDMDIYVSQGGAGATNQLWVNTAGTFVESAASAGLDAAVSGTDNVWGDFDNDGLIDLYLGAAGANKLYRNLGDTDMDNVFEFAEIGSMAGIGVDDAANSDMVHLADVDADGDLDIFVGNQSAANTFYRNDSVSARFLNVKVVGGTTAAQDARGAVVQLTDLADNVLATREINGGRGFGTQDNDLIHFGGVAPSREYKVKVTFVGGATKTVNVTPRLETNQTITITE